MFRKKKENPENPIDKITITKANNGWLVEIGRANDLSFKDKVFVYSSFEEVIESLVEIDVENDK